MPNALVELLSLDPDGTWQNLPASWYVDSEGVIHGRADHVAATAQIMNALAFIQQSLTGSRPPRQWPGSPSSNNSTVSGAQAVPTSGTSASAGSQSNPVVGSLGEMLSEELCNRKGCVSISRMVGEAGERVGRTAQLIAEASNLYAQVRELAAQRPYRLVKEGDAWKKKVAALLGRGRSAAADLEMFDRVTKSFTTGIENLRAEATRLLTSGRFQHEFLEAAAADLLWGPNGPMRDHVERIAGSVVSHGTPTSFHDGVIRSAAQLDELIGQLDKVRPQLAAQFKGLRVGDHVHPNATVADLITLRWKEAAETELNAARAEIAAKLGAWSSRRDLAVLDVAATLGAAHLPEQRETRVRMLKASSVALADLDVNPLTFSELHRGASSEVEDIIGAAQLAFPGCGGLQISSRLAVIPTVVAAALTGDDSAMYVELGVESVTSEISATLTTTDTLLRDGGVYRDVRAAWEAASKL